MDKIKIKNHKKEAHSRHNFTVEVVLNQMQAYLNQAYERLAPTVEIKGFRKGYAPKLLTISKIGQELYWQTTFDIALPDSYSQAIDQLQLKPISSPQITIASYGEGAPLVYQVLVDVLPDVDPGNYHAIKIKFPKVDTKVSTKEVEEVIERLQRQQAKLKEVDRPIKAGDHVEIDYVGEVGGIRKEDLSSKNFPLIVGKGVINKKIEDSLIGRKKGETYQFTTRMERDLVEFTISIHSLAEVELPLVDKKFALQFGKKSPEKLKEAIADQLIKEKQSKADRQLEDAVLEAIVKKAKLEVPRSLVERELDHRIEEIKQQFGVIYPKFLEQQKKSETELRKSMAGAAEIAVKTGLVIGAIAKKEGIGMKRPEGIDDAMWQKQIVREVIGLLVVTATGKKAKN